MVDQGDTNFQNLSPEPEPKPLTATNPAQLFTFWDPLRPEGDMYSHPEHR